MQYLTLPSFYQNGYKIFHGGTQIATTAGTSYSNTGLIASTAYSYTVAAYDAAGNTSAQSSAASATTQAAVAALLPPTILSPANGAGIADGTNKVTVSWTAAPALGTLLSLLDSFEGQKWSLSRPFLVLIEQRRVYLHLCGDPNPRRYSAGQGAAVMELFTVRYPSRNIDLRSRTTPVRLKLKG